jgi:hypothetical protein
VNELIYYGCVPGNKAGEAGHFRPIKGGGGAFQMGPKIQNGDFLETAVTILITFQQFLGDHLHKENCRSGNFWEITVSTLDAQSSALTSGWKQIQFPKKRIFLILDDGQNPNTQ